MRHVSIAQDPRLVAAKTLEREAGRDWYLSDELLASCTTKRAEARPTPQQIGDLRFEAMLLTVLGIAPSPGNAFELHADCLAGASASDAGQRGLLDLGDITEAVAMSVAAGDPLGLPQGTPGPTALAMTTSRRSCAVTWVRSMPVSSQFNR
jgi:hypothetical protein